MIYIHPWEQVNLSLWLLALGLFSLAHQWLSMILQNLSIPDIISVHIWGLVFITYWFCGGAAARSIFFFITSTFGRSFHSSLCFIAEFFQFFCFSRDSSISCGRDVSFNTLNCCRMFCCSCNFSWVLVTLNAYELSVLWLHIKKPTLLPALL